MSLSGKIFLKTVGLVFFILVVFSIAHADFTSTNFKLENPVNIISSGESSSSHFKYLSNTSQTTQGQSSSNNFLENVGFLYFPTATSPVVSATPGNHQVTLFWTAATGILAKITSYEVGISTTSGSGFTFMSVGSSLNTIKTDLINKTPYFFKVRSYASGLLLSESAEVSATPTAGGIVGGGGGGGMDGEWGIITGASFSGMAYPGSRIFLLKDGQAVASTFAGGDAGFKITLTGLSAGSYTFIIYAEDTAGRRSTLFAFPITLSIGVITDISGIFIAPTIAIDKEKVKKGDNLSIFGQSVPGGEVSISVHSNPEMFVRAPTDKRGGYIYNFDTSVLDFGDHLTKSKGLKTGEISSFGKTLAFSVGNETIFIDDKIIKNKNLCNVIADLNKDCRVNLVDYSILAFWYKKPSVPANVDLNHDGKVNLIDFSIMAYYWTI